MKPTHLCFIFLFLFTYSCEKDDNKLDDFLNQENIQVDLLLGEWNWEVTNGGWGTNSTPETVGYQRTISFTADRKYREYVDSELILET